MLKPLLRSKCQRHPNAIAPSAPESKLWTVLGCASPLSQWPPTMAMGALTPYRVIYCGYIPVITPTAYPSLAAAPNRTLAPKSTQVGLPLLKYKPKLRCLGKKCALQAGSTEDNASERSELKRDVEASDCASHWLQAKNRFSSELSKQLLYYLSKFERLYILHIYIYTYVLRIYLCMSIYMLHTSYMYTYHLPSWWLANIDIPLLDTTSNPSWTR